MFVKASNGREPQSLPRRGIGVIQAIYTKFGPHKFCRLGFTVQGSCVTICNLLTLRQGAEGEIVAYGPVWDRRMGPAGLMEKIEWFH